MSDALALFASIGLALALGGVGGVATAKSIPTWYGTIKKPSWNPPNWIFGPVWTLLYILMGTAAWLVWKKVGFETTWVAVYALQLALNTAWSFIFFSMQRPGLAFAEILAMWAAIVATTVIFWQINPIAGYLFLPYLAWVTFASVLNGTIWRLNPR